MKSIKSSPFVTHDAAVTSPVDLWLLFFCSTFCRTISVEIYHLVLTFVVLWGKDCVVGANKSNRLAFEDHYVGCSWYATNDLRQHGCRRCPGAKQAPGHQQPPCWFYYDNSVANVKLQLLKTIFDRREEVGNPTVFFLYFLYVISGLTHWGRNK